jgi:hypothetical protein
VDGEKTERSVSDVSPVINVQDLDSLIDAVYSIVDTHLTQTISIFTFGFAFERTDTTLVVKGRLGDNLNRIS